MAITNYTDATHLRNLTKTHKMHKMFTETHQNNVRKRKDRIMWKRIEVSDAFTDDIMNDSPASDNAMKFADYVFENYITVDSKFPLTLWTKSPDWSFPYTNNGAESYHSHMNEEFYVKHPNIYVWFSSKPYRTAID